MEKFFPFNSVGRDRVYKAEDWRAYFAQIIGDGVILVTSNALKVRQGDGMSVIVSAGGGWIAGAGYINSDDLTLTLDNADGALNRIDRIVLRADYTERSVTARIKKGSVSAQPVAPALQRDADAYELGLADIYIAKGVIEITQANITDLRLNKELCGIVTGVIEQADTTEIFNQFETYFQEFKTAYVQSFSDWAKDREDELLAWVQEQETELTSWETKTRGDLEQWILNLEGGLTDWENDVQRDFESWKEGQESAMELWETQKKAAFELWQGSQEASFEAWETITKQEYDIWLDNLKAQLDENVAAHLQHEIEVLQEDLFNKYYGLTAQETVFSEDGNTITTTNAEATVVTTFGYNDDGDEIAVTTVTPTGKGYSFVKTTTFTEYSITSTIERRV